MQPIDLRKQQPRGPREKVGGLYMLGRTIDKLRGSLPGGDLGPYHVFFGLSWVLAHELGIDLQDLAGVVRDARSEDDVVTWVHSHSDPSQYEQINEALSTRAQADVHPKHRERFESKYSAELRAQHDNLFDLIEADDSLTPQ